MMGDAEWIREWEWSLRTGALGGPETRRWSTDDKRDSELEHRERQNFRAGAPRAPENKTCYCIQRDWYSKD